VAVKNYVLDTNVLLHDPRALYAFADNNVIVPIYVIEEIDTFKKDQSELGRNARTIARLLDHHRADGGLSQPQKMDNGGTVRVEISSSTLELKRTRFDRRNAADPAADAPRFDLKIVAKPGDHELSIDARFWVCGTRTCRPVRARRTVAVHAAEPAPAP